MVEWLQRCEERALAGAARAIPDSAVPAARVLTELGGVPEVRSAVAVAALLAAESRGVPGAGRHARRGGRSASCIG